MNILVVEDNYFIADLIRLQLEDAGYSVLGPVRSVNDALKLVDKLDFAILDVNLGESVSSLPIAEVLETVNKPFLFITGYDRSFLKGMQDRPTLSKPYKKEDLITAIRNLTRNRV